MDKLLILTSRLPVPVTGGDKIRILNICRGLSEEFDLILLSLCSSKEEMEFRSPDLNIFKEVHRIYLSPTISVLNVIGGLLTGEPLQVAYYRSAAFAHKVTELIPRVEGIVAHLVRTSEYVRNVKGTIKVLEMTDAISMTYRRLMHKKTKTSLRSVIYAIEFRRLQKYERNVIENFDMVSLISPVDRDYLIEMGAPAGLMDIFTNGVNLIDLPYAEAGEGTDVVFVGNMRTIPNIDACRFMATEVLPILRRSAPIQFRIIGETPQAVAKEFNGYDGVTVVGRVPEIANAVTGAFASVCPMRFGAGVQNKVLEYLALGLPCVTTSLGLEGIAATPGRDLLVADEAEDIAKALLDVCNDRSLSRRLSISGRKFVEAEHTWSPIQRSYCDRLRGLTISREVD